jgi:hypothetical protein
VLAFSGVDGGAEQTLHGSDKLAGEGMRQRISKFTVIVDYTVRWWYNCSSINWLKNQLYTKYYRGVYNVA